MPSDGEVVGGACDAPADAPAALQRKQLIGAGAGGARVDAVGRRGCRRGLRRPADAPAALQRKQLIEQALVEQGVMESDGRGCRQGLRRSADAPAAGLHAALSRSYRTGVLLDSGLSILQLAPPYLTKVAIDTHIAAGDVEGLTRLALLLLGVLVLSYLFEAVQTHALQVTGQRIIFDLRMQIHGHLQRLDVAFFDRNPGRPPHDPGDDRRRRPERPVRVRRRVRLP